MLAVVDTGPLYAAADTSDADHTRCLSLLQRREIQLVIPALVVAEATYLVGSRLGPVAEASFLRALQDFHVESPQSEDWPLIAGLVDDYADFPLGGTDASVIALAARINATVVLTLDRRHFAVVRPPHCESFTLLPD